LTKSKDSPITVGIISEATSAKALYFPATFFAAANQDQPPSQILLWNEGNRKKRSVVLSVSRMSAGTPAGDNPILFSALGGSGSTNLHCRYRKATTWHKIRFIPGVALNAAVVIAAFFASGLTAYQTFAGSLQSTGTKTLVGFAATVLFMNGLMAFLTAVSQWQKLG